jgi:hypothetical protein
MKTPWITLQEWLVDEPEYRDLTPHDILARMKAIEDDELSEEEEPNPADILAAIIWRLTEESHHHVWDILGVSTPPVNQKIHPRMAQSLAITLVLVRCQECNFPATIELDGTWTEEQVTAKLTEPIND